MRVLAGMFGPGAGQRVDVTEMRRSKAQGARGCLKPCLYAQEATSPGEALGQAMQWPQAPAVAQVGVVLWHSSCGMSWLPLTSIHKPRRRSPRARLPVASAEQPSHPCRSGSPVLARAASFAAQSRSESRSMARSTLHGRICECGRRPRPQAKHLDRPCNGRGRPCRRAWPCESKPKPRTSGRPSSVILGFSESLRGKGAGHNQLRLRTSRVWGWSRSS